MGPITYPPDLPITARREEIVAALRGHQVVVVAGETGSGKTTQLPKMCLEAGLGERGRVGCTQPRRVAALSVSRRVAEELGVTWGREVGCKIRFQDDTSRETRVKFMTDGILLAEVQSDPMLRGYSCLILDEAHERSLNIDFLLGHLVGLLKRRPDLKLVVTSATIDTEAFSQAFGGAPVVEVSGRLFPVEIRYAPPGSGAGGEDEEDPGHVEAAVRATEDALIEFDDGDVLVFLPTERDIREAVDALDGRLGAGFEVLGLFGRMPAGEQTRIFSPGPRRRVIVATNIAETSLTLPRIACVVDAGLARMSRYQPRTRTKRLPVEAISQSSANQRAGRAGRVRAGTCVRLYSEEEFNKRPRWTQPEIQRANLAEVILRMKASRLGDIETFPFLSPPSAAAIRAGYALLQELGALDEANVLTPLGAELARLPIDPTLGRMLLQARREGVLGEMLVIAAGLSVPDPRERPEAQREAAAAAHRKFADPTSDFLSLLRLWRAAPAPDVRGWGTALRKFCKAHFLSLVRMREWRDLHGQLGDAMGARGAGESAARDPADAIHRSVLTGLLGQIALREKTNFYRASGNRMLTVFPGSNLFERRDRPKPGRKREGGEELPKEEPTRQPPWIVAGEIVETSQLWARTVGGIDPEWVVELGAHLCEFRYVEPHWSAKAGRVLVTERVLLHGLEVSRRFVDHGRINAAEATELFIRGALVGEEARLPHRFFAENAKLVAKLEEGLVRVRSRWAHSLEEMLFRFYAVRIKDVSSVPDLNRLVRERVTREPNFLIATETDLIGDNDAGFDAALFPAQASLSNLVLPLSYAYAPGEDRDGVTVRVPLPAAEHLTSGQVQWLVPGMREEQITTLLRALPKTLRNALRPHRPDAAAIAREFDPGRSEFLPALAAFLSKKFGVPVSAEDWPANALPAHLRPRVEVIDAKQRTVIAGRDLAAVRAEAAQKDVRTGAWDAAVKRWERRGARAWDFGDLPDEITVEEIGGAPVLAFPGLERSGDAVDVRLHRRREEADVASPGAVRRLGELALARDLERAAKDFTALGRPAGPNAKPDFRAALTQLVAKPPTAAAAEFTAETFQRSGRQHLVEALLTLAPLRPLSAARYQAMIEAARRGIIATTWQTVERAKQILAQRSAVLAQPKRYPGLEADVARLVPPDFLARTPADRLPHLPRYLRAVQVRAERAALHPAKDAEKAKPLAEFKDWEARVPPANRESFRWLLEEFRVSLFAPELGTAQPASAARLRALVS